MNECSFKIIVPRESFIQPAQEAGMITSIPGRVVVCGGGLAGLTAAVTALEKGAAVTLVEKAPELGGTTAISGGLLWTYADYDQLRAHIPKGDPLLQWMVLETFDESVDWLVSQGVHRGPEQTLFVFGRGWNIDPPQAVAMLTQRFEALGGEWKLATGLESIFTTDGAVTAVRCVTSGTLLELPANAVILATGGFQANPELLTRYLPSDPSELFLRAKPWSTGDGLLAAIAVGAAASSGLDKFYGHAQSVLPRPPGFEDLRTSSQFYGRMAVALNLLGDRFADESAGNGEEILNQQLFHQPEARGFYVIDQRIMAEPAMDGVDISTRALVERVISAGGIVLTGQTLEELCVALGQYGIPTRRALLTLNEFNAMIEDGRADELVPPRMAYRQTLAHPPFVAVAVRATITFTTGGLQTDEHTRVVHRAGSSGFSTTMPEERAFVTLGKEPMAIGPNYRQTVIKGLFAAGNDIGNIHHSGYMGALAVALTTGREAGRQAAKLVSDD
jgi:succinate dehydrogenase/fumarate reductase flavoprotein subunit